MLSLADYALGPIKKTIAYFAKLLFSSNHGPTHMLTSVHRPGVLPSANSYTLLRALSYLSLRTFIIKTIHLVSDFGFMIYLCADVKYSFYVKTVMSYNRPLVFYF